MQIKLQIALQQLKLLGAAEAADGIFGSATRAAIVAWQSMANRDPTGLLGNGDARILLQSAADFTIFNNEQQKTDMKESRRRELISKFGSHADAIIAGEIQLEMTKDEVVESQGRPHTTIIVSPIYEVWVYDTNRVAFTQDRVSHVGR
jgi:peptidoglycan hydrolase-like protein with peptidoglycan-binding domain